MKDRFKIDIPDYIKTLWQPHIVDPLTHDVVSEGTRFTSIRANNFEEGIYVNRELHKLIYNEILRLKTETEIGNRVPGGNSFFDVGTGDKEDIKGIVLQDLCSFTTNISEGKDIPIYDAEEYESGRFYTIYDDENIELVEVDRVDRDNNRIILKESLSTEYKKGARLCSSNIKIDEGFHFDYWTNIKVTGEVI